MADYLMNISDQEFHQMRDLIYNRFGINLTEQKRSLLVGRLQKFINVSGLRSFKEYYELLLSGGNDGMLGELVDRISTNYTYFNREKAHFDYYFNSALPSLVKRLRQGNARSLRIWCAGCSTGEEPYMLMMMLLEYLGHEYSDWDSGILATDISQRALIEAKKGIYPEDRVNALPSHLKSKYFTKLPDGNCAVVDRVKQEVLFRRFNLMNETFPFKKRFHIIFCRNVMIYFDQTTRETLTGKFHQLTEPGGYLFIGHSETLGRAQNLYKYIMPAAYQKSE